eukprot:CAMPEP_0175174876 /NCGR_PEP_ID=MMETSP0087-20121206/32889_1 /TAXON_ID=136419 /ORGANISM="Unknown Unknown, Strain D1" /LENGTH=164 /DNA_ID=CAMNT_0016466421 /DNA_START=1 /DNA_END=496 /DNA_ORIENTATION=-
MEYVPGKSVDTLLEKFGAFDEQVTRSYTKQLLESLALWFSQANAGHAGKDAPSVSYNYTPLWTAPEVLQGDYNSKVDVWSLGCVVVEMASGKPPWSEENFENPFRALYHIGNSNKIPQIPQSMSEEAKDFVQFCLKRDPDERPTAKEMLSHQWMRNVVCPVAYE